MTSIRPATAADMAAVADLWHEGWHSGHAGHVPDRLTDLRTLAAFHERTPTRVGDTAVAISESGDLLGFVMVVGDEVEQVFVGPAARGTGLAPVLLAEAERLVVAGGYDRAWLAVVAGNARARRFYEKCGWADDGELPYSVTADGETFVSPCRRYVKDVRVASAVAGVYVDMVGDLFHAGHVALLREARRHGDRLVVGVLSDDTVAAYKRRPIMTLAERVAVIEACRYVDEVVADAPFRVTEDFLATHAITTVVHGDDLPQEAAETIYGPAVIAGTYVSVPRTSSISTTQLIQRVFDAGAPAVPETPAASPGEVTTTTGRADPDLDQRLNDELSAYNADATPGIAPAEELTVRMEEGGELIAGASGWTWGRAAGIGMTWVRHDRRGTGLGARLLGAFESEAAERGCTHVFVTSFTFQAPEFYQRLGYEEIFRWESVPTPGRDDVHMRKDL